jgi:CDP-diglyceride synthetase
MMEDELVKIWQSSPSLEQIKFEKSRLMLDVQAGINRVDKLIKYRDAIESGTAIFIVVPAFTYAAFQMPNILTKLACVFIIFWAFYLVYRFRAARKYKPGEVTDNYVEYLSKTKQHLLVQKKLVDTVVWWYIIPAQSGVTLFTLGIALESGNYEGLIKMEILGLMLAIVTIYMNKQTLRKTLNPRLKKIDELIRVMDN